MPNPGADFYSELGSRVREARRAIGLTQSALAQAAGLTRASVANIEAGRQKILAHHLVSIAAATGTKPEALLPGRPPERVDAAKVARQELDKPQADWVSAVLQHAADQPDEGRRR
ncbi:helix-turn-helix domain-containing protein [Promicromonospora panici]|uniref:helix-turn-helix domain-containing protein n=1 Tax=Promicromonospora panici TaxID=2219658 RepID=UPI0013EB9D31|nr:helix-turn-helix transcriptional regulator [Promicromonospora panici]